MHGAVAMQNGAASRANDELSVAEIKDRAKVHAQKATRGASALHLIRAARSQLALAHTYERDGDLKDAYAAYIKSVALIQTFMDSVEFKAENRPGKHGVLFKEYQEYMQVGCLRRLTSYG
jgi:ubiquitin carboxyl-terminal hydrolase 8